MTISPEDVLTFWFEEAGPDKWFEKSDDFDAEIADRFGAATHDARAGEIAEFTGISAPYEEPVTPELVVDTSNRDVDSCLDELVAYVKTNFSNPG